METFLKTLLLIAFYTSCTLSQSVQKTATTQISLGQKKSTNHENEGMCEWHTPGVCNSIESAECEYFIFHRKEVKRIQFYYDAPLYSYLVEKNNGTCENVWISKECRIQGSSCDTEEYRVLFGEQTSK